MSWFKVTFWFLYFSLLVLLITCFSSCNPVKQATKHYNKAKEKSAVTVAKMARTDFPCITTFRDTGRIEYRPGQPIIVKDTQLLTVDCPDNSPGAKPGATKPTLVNAPCNCKTTTDTLVVPINNYIEDSAKTKEAYHIRDQAVKESDKYKSRSETKGWIIRTLIGLFILYLIITRILKLF